MRRKVFYCSSNSSCHFIFYFGSLIYKFLEKNGFAITANSDEADFIIINTCGFAEEREAQALALINLYSNKYFDGKQIIVFGCLAKINPMLNLPRGVLKRLILIGPKEIEKFNLIFSPKTPIENIRINRLDKRLISEDRYRRKDYYILISQGCVNHCAYCAIKKAKGHVVSKPPEAIIGEFKRGLGLGFKYFTLLADDCGSYGVDLGTDLAELLNALCRIEGDYKFTIYFLEPFRLEFLFSKINKQVFRKIYFMCLPLQSCSQRIIRLMNRKYDLKKIVSIIKKIKEFSPALKLRTTLIFNYPTETEREFLSNLTHPALRYFDEVNLFCYSKRKGTPAAELRETATKEEKKRRTEMAAKISRERSNFVPFNYNK